MKKCSDGVSRAEPGVFLENNDTGGTIRSVPSGREGPEFFDGIRRGLVRGLSF